MRRLDISFILRYCEFEGGFHWGFDCGPANLYASTSEQTELRMPQEIDLRLLVQRGHPSELRHQWHIKSQKCMLTPIENSAPSTSTGR